MCANVAVVLREASVLHGGLPQRKTEKGEVTPSLARFAVGLGLAAIARGARREPATTLDVKQTRIHNVPRTRGCDIGGMTDGSASRPRPAYEKSALLAGGSSKSL